MILRPADIDHVMLVKDGRRDRFLDLFRQVVDEGARDIPDPLRRQDGIAEFENLGREIEELAVRHRVAFTHKGQKDAACARTGIAGFAGNICGCCSFCQ